jgi:hypothetical protein
MVTGGGILEGGKEHAARQMALTERTTSFKSEIGFDLSTPDGVVRRRVVKRRCQSTSKSGAGIDMPKYPNLA